jgi:hypothetical protein
MIIVFIICLLLWFSAIYWFLQDRTFNRLFGVLMMGVITYLSFELTAWSFRPPLPVMMAIGLLPIISVAYGYRYYEHKYRLPQKTKNEDKTKIDEAVDS